MSIFNLLKKITDKPKVSLFETEQESRLKHNKSHKQWLRGWKRHCSSRAQIRRIGSRARAIELGIIKG